MIKNFVKILELLGDRLEVCVSVFNPKSAAVHLRRHGGDGFKSPQTCRESQGSNSGALGTRRVTYLLPWVVTSSRPEKFMICFYDGRTPEA